VWTVARLDRPPSGHHQVMAHEDQKRAAALAALEHISPGAVIGVGTGSTVAFFIEALGALPGGRRPVAAVASSEATARALRTAGIAVVGLDEVAAAAAREGVRIPPRPDGRPAPLPVYVDGADEVDAELRLIKGGGGAHTREKVLATASELFVCIVDESKLVQRLGAFPVPVEVMPMAAVFVAERLTEAGVRAVPRPGYLTDNGNVVLDVTGLDLADPEGLEVELDSIPGVVECGIFARRRADVLLVGGEPVRRISAAGLHGGILG
jgi:ribose 5-phosphate isomerase A